MQAPRFLTLAAALATLATLPDVATATDGTARRPIVRHEAERLEIVVAAADTLRLPISLDDVLESDVMAFRFAVDAVDATGTAVRLPADFAMMIALDGHGTRSRLRLTGIEREVSLPRPLGVRVSRTGRLDLLLSAAGLAVDGISLRLVIEHERDGRAGSRIPVRSTDLVAAARLADGPSWEWTAPERGRLLAISGLQLERLDGVELVDAESGEILWSTTLRGSATGATATQSVRMGVPVLAGRTYRLSVRGVVGAGRGIVALVLPTSPMVAASVSGR